MSLIERSVAAYPIKTRIVHTLLICSGGLDSVTLAYQLAHLQSLHTVVSFVYGQKHHKEIQYAQRCSQRLNVPHTLLDITTLQTALAPSALTDTRQAVPDGAYQPDTVASTVVPNRNPIMLTIAFALAVRLNCHQVAIATHTGDHPIYPDCTPQFLQTFEAMQKKALAGIAEIALHAPFTHLSKADIVTIGDRLGVPFAATWSCYKGQTLHCGVCPTCLERKAAFTAAGVVDPSQYAA